MGKQKKRVLLGFGFDCDDGHKRITMGGNFRLYGGSEQTHQLMQEKAVKFNEHLEKSRKTLEQISFDEFSEIAEKLGLKPVKG